MTTFMTIDNATGAIYIECDGCRKTEVVSLPMLAFEFTARLLAFDADHRFCQVRPVQRCQYVAVEDGACAHERNLTPECSLAVCPLG